MDTALKNAQERLANVDLYIAERKGQISELQAQLDKAEKEREAIRNFIVTWYEMAGIQLPESMEQTENISDAAAARTRPKNPDREFVVDKSLEIIRANGNPLPRKELFDALATQGIEIRGKDPEMVLSTMLWRSKGRIVRLQPYGYWPADTEYPPAHYDPAWEDFLEVASKEPEGGIEADDAEEETGDELPLA